MAYQVTSKTSYGSRLSNSLKGIGGGLLMFLAGTVLLFWNEGRTVKTAKMLKQAEKVCVHVDDIASVDPSLEGQVIHATAFADTRDSLCDDVFPVGARAIRIERQVSYYQWVEHSSSQTKDKIGGGQETVTTYTYSKEWVPFPVNSSSFSDPEYKNLNSVRANIESGYKAAENVSFGGYRLSPGLASQIGGARGLDVPQSLNKEGQTVQGNTVYIGSDPANPEIGDVKVAYTRIDPATVSIIAKVTGDTFEPFVAKNGYSLSTLSMGTVSMENMFAQERQSNNVMKWIFRLLGFLLVLFGLKGILGIVVAILKVIPFLANIVNLAVNVVVGVVAFAWSLLVIAVAWIVYRPVLGVILLAAGGAALWWFSKKGAEAKAKAGDEPIPGSAAEAVSA